MGSLIYGFVDLTCLKRSSHMLYVVSHSCSHVLGPFWARSSCIDAKHALDRESSTQNSRIPSQAKSSLPELLLLQVSDAYHLCSEVALRMQASDSGCIATQETFT